MARVDVARLIREVARQVEADGRALRQQWELLKDKLDYEDDTDYAWDWDGDDYEAEQLPPSFWTAQVIELAKRV